jgi:D-glycero-alpha-D-manno-heptose-7-phosphate kinase
MQAGAKAVKISGAGGGGFMMISVEPTQRHKIMTSLNNSDGVFQEFSFVNHGVETWKVC